jgi:hypothetical protein
VPPGVKGGKIIIINHLPECALEIAVPIYSYTHTVKTGIRSKKRPDAGDYVYVLFTKLTFMDKSYGIKSGNFHQNPFA